MFPEEYTEFLNKRDAKYDGDPEGDYIVAEHVNKLQDAVVAIERALGKHPNKNQSLISRIQELEGIRPMRVPAFQWFSSALPADVTQAKKGIERYSGLILSQRSQTLSAVLEDYNYPVYGVVNAQLPLSSIQTEIGDWKLAGATGIFLTDFQAVYNRSLEQNILNSIAQRNMNSLIQTTNPERLFSNTIISDYNDYGDSLNFPSGSGLFLQNFAYSGRQYTSSEIMARQEPLIRLAKSKNLDIVVQGQSINQETYHYIQASGLIFSVDGFYDGPAGGTNWGSETPYYAWQAPLLAWQTNTPIIEQASDGLSRQLKDGYISINDDMSVTIKGHQIDSTLLDWVSSSVPGHVLKDASVHPSKLSTYDIQKIVDLLNNSSDDIQIDLTKINMPDGALPANIPAENMIVNVIEAINRKANPLSTNKTTISDAAIQSLDAAKLTGSIHRERFEQYVIAAINASDSLTNYIDVLRLDADNINSTGVISANQIVADGINTRIINATESITSVDLVTSGYHTGHEGEYERLTVDWLTAYKLDGLKELHVETLTADNIGALVLEAIDAEITNGRFNNIVTQALTAETIKTDLVVALNSITQTQITNSALFGEAVIKDAAIENISVDKLKAGVINTSLINLSSPDGHLKIEDKTIRIYDDVDGSGNRRLRVVLGSTEEVAGGEGSYGLVVLGPDGTTRLYDHTGIYNAGLHDNVISEEKLQDDSISERVIRAGAIHTDHLDARIITSEKIAVDAILAEHIVASQITGAHIAGETITGNNIKAGAIKSGHIEAGSIDASHIKARSINTDQLKIGFTANIIRDGYDSFEQEPLGIFLGQTIAGNPIATINRTWSWDGRNSISVTGNTASNRIMLAKSDIDYTIPVMPGRKYFVSATVRTESINEVPITIGLGFNKGERVIGTVETVSKTDRIKKIWVEITSPGDSLRAAIILGVESTNVAVWFDCLQVEEAEEGQLQPGFWKATATTRIDGASIETGYVKAEHIRIGSGTVFGANNDIIDITDTGITAKSVSGSASLNSKGLEIKGGAFILEGGIGKNSVKINGQSGVEVENSQSLIQMNGEKGFRIISKARNQVVMDIEPETGDIRFSGKARFYSADNPEMAWSIEEKMNNIENSLMDNSQEIEDANKSANDALKNIEELEKQVAYRVDLTSSKGLIFRNGNIETNITATAYRGTTDITETLPKSAFVWQKTNKDGIRDSDWELAHVDVGHSLNVDYTMVKGQANIQCLLNIPET